MSPANAIPATVRIREVPDSEPELLKRLDAVLAASHQHGASISEIHLPLARYSTLANVFWHIPIVDSAQPFMRVIYSAAPAR